MTSKIPSSLGPTISINVNLLWSFMCGWASWSFWPKTSEWWGFGLLSVCLAFASLAAFVSAVKLMLKVRSRERMVRDFLAIGTEPKSSELASPAALRDGGMF